MATEKEKLDVWNKGATIRGQNPDVYRRDSEGNKIRFASYGATTDLGWEIDHIKPTARGGADTLANKQPLQTAANRAKSDEVKK